MAAEKVKGAATKGYEIGKKATQDVIENIEQAAQKTGEKIKQTAGKAHGEFSTKSSLPINIINIFRTLSVSLLCLQ